MSFQEQEGGFVRSERTSGGGGFNRQKASQAAPRPKKEKSYEDIVAEREAARKRWSGVLPLVAAREMIAEANLSEDAIVEMSAAVIKLNEAGELEAMIRSGELADMLG